MTAAVPNGTIADTRQGDQARQHLRGSTLLLSGRFISLAINLAVQVLAVRYLSKSSYGALAFALSMASLGASFSAFGMDKTVSRLSTIYHERGDDGGLFGTLLVMITSILGLGTALVLAVVAGRGWLGGTFDPHSLSVSLLMIVIVLAPVNALDSLFGSLFAVLASPRAIFVRRHLVGPGLKLAAVLTVIALQGDVQMLAIGYVMGAGLGLLVYAAALVHLLHRRGLLARMRTASLKFHCREVFSYGLSFFTSDATFLVRGTLVVVLLEYLRGSESVAEFRAVLPIARLNEVVAASFGLLYIPVASRLFAQNQHDRIDQLYWRTAAWITVLSFPMFAVSFALAEPLTVFLFGTQYAGTGIILAILAIGYFLNSALGFNSHTLKVVGRVRYIFFLDVLATVAAVFLYFLLIPTRGAVGGAVAATVTLIIHAVLRQWCLSRQAGVSLLPRGFVAPYVAVFAATGVLLSVQIVLDPPLYVGLFLAALASLVVALVSRSVLDVHDIFPELARFPLVGRFLRSVPAGAPAELRNLRVTGDIEKQLIERLREKAGDYYACGAGKHVGVELVSSQQRPLSSLYEFQLTVGADRHQVLAKVPRTALSVQQPSEGSSLKGDERPRLAPVFDAARKFEYEQHTLRAIDDHYSGLADPRFGAIRVLDVIEGHGAIIMERSHDIPLRRLLLRTSRLPFRSASELVESGLRNAGAWLREYHHMPDFPQTQLHHATRREFVDSIWRYCEYLRDFHPNACPILKELPSKMEQLAYTALAATLPLGIAHGDYAPRNILVGPGGRVTVIDTTGRWRVPIYEDLADFLKELSASPPLIYSGGMLFAPRQVAHYRAVFLKGYFDTDAVPQATIGMFEIQSLLDKWVEQADNYQRTTGLRSVQAHCRLFARSRFYARRIVEIVNELQSSAEKEALDACRA
jgi:O-antigen/teichoic acid export membrane protein